uniref:G protein-coupled receptor 39-2 n=2 Tax=Latimeria chalumnae TaxID=7897 RepID=H3BEQ2_LATCH
TTEGSQRSTSRFWHESVELSFRGKAAVSAVYGVLFVVGVLGNVAVIRVIQILRGKNQIQEIVNSHMVSMACSNLLILMVGIPTELYSIIWCPSPWPTGNLGCKGFYFVWEVSSYATIYNILTFSCERYLATCHPLQVKAMPSSRSKKLVALVWLVAIISGLPTLFAIGVEDALLLFWVEQSGESDPTPILICTNVSDQSFMFEVMVYTSFSLYILVLLLVAFTCRQMCGKLLKDKSNSLRVKSKDGSIHRLPKFTYSEGGSTRKQNIIMLGCLVGALAIFWVPFQCRRLMTVLRSKTQWTKEYYQSYITLQPITNSFYYLSFTVNPLLYNVTSKQFRRLFRQVLKGRCR